MTWQEILIGERTKWKTFVALFW